MNRLPDGTELVDVLDSMHDGLFLVSPEGKIVMVNEPLLKMTGFTREELIGQTCSVFRCDECNQHRQYCGDSWCRLFADGKAIRQPCRIFAKDGRCLEILKGSRVVRDGSGQIYAAVENVTDISDLQRAEKRINVLEKVLDDASSFCGMIGRSESMRNLFEFIEKAAQGESTVIIYGESGVGKELVAQAIHRLGPRRQKPFVQVNCAALSESLLESELFGHVRGAFTGAHCHRVGRFEEAGSGDLFLDEVGDIPLPTQVKLLRVLEARTFERVGANAALPMEARVISATNQDLGQMINDGRFRPDLFYRLNVVPLHVPPLRERREDIPLMVQAFVGRLCRNLDRDLPGMTPAAMERLMGHDWPGNVRELRSTLEYAFVVCGDGPIDVRHLPPAHFGAGPHVVAAAEPTRRAPAQSAPSAPAAPELSPAEQHQRDELVAALRHCEGNKSAVARKLGVTRVTVLNRIRKYGINLHRLLAG